jgi:hypothetical protein
MMVLTITQGATSVTVNICLILDSFLQTSQAIAKLNLKKSFLTVSSSPVVFVINTLRDNIDKLGKNIPIFILHCNHAIKDP